MVLMNPKDEEEKDEETLEEIGRMQTDVTDEDMAQRWLFLYLFRIYKSNSAS